MKVISGPTFAHKRVFPAIWFGFLGLFVIFSLLNADGVDAIPFLIAPLLMGVFGYFIYRKLIWDLADEVRDFGEYLEFRRGEDVQRVPLADIVNINFTQMVNPQRVEVQVREEGAIGKVLVFRPPPRISLFSRHPVVVDLIERVDQARRKRPTY